MDPTEEPATCQVLGRPRSLSMGSITRRGAIDSSQPRGHKPRPPPKLPGESKPLPHALSLGDGLDREKRDGGCFRLQSEGAWASAGPCERLRSSLSTLFSEAGPPVAGVSCGLVSKAAVGRGTCKNRESESNGQFIFTHSRQGGDGLRRVIAGRYEQGRHTLAWSVFFFSLLLGLGCWSPVP